MQVPNEGKGIPDDAAKSEMALARCLVEGDSKETSRTLGKSFGASVAIEMLLLGMLVAAPLLTSVAQPRLSIPTFVPFFFGPRHPIGDVTHPMNPANPRPDFGDKTAIYPSNQPPRQPIRPPEGPGDPAPEVIDAIPGGTDFGASPFAGVHPSVSILPPAEIKRSTEKSPLKISGPVIEAQLISRIEPRYPPLALQMRLSGTVVLHAIIGRDGRVNALEVVSGSPFFAQAALDAVREWRYRPTMLNGEPVEVDTTITVIFRLHE